MSQRRIALILNLNRKTVVRKFLFLGALSTHALLSSNLKKQKSSVVEFDDLETFEHSKCKPLSVTMVVESGTRRILDFEVSPMPCKGRLAQTSRKKYGPRKDRRPQARSRLFQRIGCLVNMGCEIKSDQSPHYPADVKKYFPESLHTTFKGRRGRQTGQGELKLGGFDPLFSLNHTYAMLRSNINRLQRKTWATTKKLDRLKLHIALYAYFHNHTLLKHD